MALTATEVAGAKRRSDGKAYKLFDQGGLYLHVTEQGTKYWRYQYRLNGKQNIFSIGSYANATGRILMSLQEARDAHAEAQKLVERGVHPKQAREEKKAAAQAAKVDSFATVARMWLAWWRTAKSQRHVATTESRLNGKIIPALGKLGVNDITAKMVREMAQAIERESGSEMADRCLMVVKQVLRYAVAHQYLEANPASEIKPSEILKERKQVNFARLNEKELPGLLQAIELYQGTPLARLGMKLMAYTLLRTGELINLEWADVDLNAQTITIPGERMKAGRDHIVPLSTQATLTLHLLKQISGKGRYVFPGKQGAATMSNMTLLLMFKRLGYGKKMTSHGWRGAASTILNEKGFNRDWIEMALAHVPDGVRHDYNKALYLDGRRQMLQWWADRLDALKAVATEATAAA